MDTNELIKALAADTGRPATSLSTVWWGAAALAVAIAAAVFLATLGPRPDIAAAAVTPHFLFKFVVMLTLAGGAFGALRAFPAGREPAQGAAAVDCGAGPAGRGCRGGTAGCSAGNLAGKDDRHQ